MEREIEGREIEGREIEGREIKVEIGDDIDDVLALLSAAKKSGESVWCIFSGCILSSDDTLDSAYKKVFGCTVAEYNRIMEEIEGPGKKK